MESIDICTPAEKIEFIEAHELDKWLDEGISGMILQSVALNMDGFTSTPPEIQKVLDMFKDIFSEPTTLPPQRSCDHRIPLLLGTTPPNVIPYRVPHARRDEMERQVHTLLASKIIRASQSPYAAPTILFRKTDTTWRLHRENNATTMKNKFPVPVSNSVLKT